MNKQSKIQAMREWVTQFVPEVIELKFGSLVNNGQDVVIGFGKNDQVFLLNEKGGRWTCNRSKLIQLYGISRDIRLADVLLAMQNRVRNCIGVDMNGCFLDCDDNMKEVKILDYHWDLTHDSLDAQSEETLDFLLSLKQ